MRAVGTLHLELIAFLEILRNRTSDDIGHHLTPKMMVRLFLFSLKQEQEPNKGPIFAGRNIYTCCS